MTKIHKCTCVHKQQDALHGAGMRVHNKMFKGEKGSQKWRCTVCKTEREIGEGGK